MSASQNVTALLGASANGDRRALDDLTSRVYAELRQLAAAYLRNERPDHTLQPTALWLQSQRNASDFADLLALEDVLRVLEELDTRKCRAIELYYFGGLSKKEIAEAFNLPVKTIRRDLAFAQAWLCQEMRKGKHS